MCDPGHYEQVTIRLAEIDAPEKAQPFGHRSKEALSAQCFGVVAAIKPRTLDRYGRTVARVECRGEDASSQQVRKGLAWAFTRYLTDPAIRDAENAARGAKVGLWADQAPVAPWDWRREQKQRASRLD